MAMIAGLSPWGGTAAHLPGAKLQFGTMGLYEKDRTHLQA